MGSNRALTLFEESCRTKKTRELYRMYLDKFLEWSNKDYDSLLFLEKSEITNLVVDYIIHMKKRVSPNTMMSVVSPIFKFLDVNEREYNKKKILMVLPERVKPQTGRAITTEELNQMLESSVTLKDKALIHVLSSTGARPEAIAELQLRHVKKLDDDYTRLTMYAGSLHEYITFLHPEASKVLYAYLNEREKLGEKLNEFSYLIRKDRFVITENKPKPLNSASIGSIMRRAMRRGHINRRKAGFKDHDRYDLPVCTGIRKRFNTILKANPKISYATSELFMDHKVRLEGHYNKPTESELLQAYKLAVPELVITDSARKESLIQEQEIQITELKEKEAQISELEKRFEDFKKESRDEIDKLRWINAVKTRYLEKGEFPEVFEQDGKIVRKFKSLEALEEDSKTKNNS